MIYFQNPQGTVRARFALRPRPHGKHVGYVACEKCERRRELTLDDTSFSRRQGYDDEKLANTVESWAVNHVCLH